MFKFRKKQREDGRERHKGTLHHIKNICIEHKKSGAYIHPDTILDIIKIMDGEK